MKRMTADSNSLKLVPFSQDFPTWSTRFIAFMQSEGLCKTLIVNEVIITRPYNLPINPPTQKRAARDAQQREYTIKNEDKVNPNNFVWFDLALTLDSAPLIEIRHNRVDADRTSCLEVRSGSFSL